MYRTSGISAVALAALLLGDPAAAQSLLEPTPPPIVTAERETWYLNGEPISYAGDLYYPAGPQEFFNPNEMVRSGHFMGVPLYTRTTLEPFSVVYVPLPGRRMQPYQRGRTREIAGTTGSRPTAVTTPYEPGGGAADIPQAPAPPSLTPFLAPFGQEPVTSRAPDPAAERLVQPSPQERSPVGTTGPVAPPQRPSHVRIGGRPQGINAIFVDFQDQRWYSTGRTVEVDPTRMERIGDYHGFEVWEEPVTRGQRIYMAVTRGGTLAVPYSKTRPRGLLR